VVAIDDVLWDLQIVLPCHTYVTDSIAS